eukprot:GHVQ01042510.1.p1 GENE.GHVQ01042510.1~~GHVQ01042510.1.p1  ORF type:complete len:129 (+),score=13.22 GHVQ01042510.1:267-653(+)
MYSPPSLSASSQGSKALPRLHPYKNLPGLCMCCFFCGAAMEYVMCLTGFYNVTSVNHARRAAEYRVEDEAFWDRVKARRQARQVICMSVLVFCSDLCISVCVSVLYRSVRWCVPVPLPVYKCFHYVCT